MIVHVHTCRCTIITYGVILRVVRAGCHPVAIAQVHAVEHWQQVRGPRFNPGWLPVFHSSLEIFLSLFISYIVHVHVYTSTRIHVHVHVYTSIDAYAHVNPSMHMYMYIHVHALSLTLSIPIPLRTRTHSLPIPAPIVKTRSILPCLEEDTTQRNGGRRKCAMWFGTRGEGEHMCVCMIRKHACMCVCGCLLKGVVVFVRCGSVMHTQWLPITQ